MKTSKWKSAITLSIIVLILAGFTFCFSGQKNPGSSKSEFLRGLYVPNPRANSIKYIDDLLARSRPHGINMLIIDVHPYMVLRPRINREVIKRLKKENIYLAARVACFQDGLKRLPVPEKYMKRLHGVIEAALDAGFHEINLDYIRFADGGAPYSRKKKYAFISGLLAEIKARTDARGVKLSTDVFGRIVYNRSDIIGQQLELFSKYSDVIYPMLYPSHFIDSPRRLKDPGGTMLEGTQKGITRLKGGSTKIHPFIQCFPYNIKWARMSLVSYVKEQIVAVESTSARGWVAWNAKGDYKEVFTALKNMKGSSLIYAKIKAGTG